MMLGSARTFLVAALALSAICAVAAASSPAEGRVRKIPRSQLPLRVDLAASDPFTMFNSNFQYEGGSTLCRLSMVDPASHKSVSVAPVLNGAALAPSNNEDFSPTAMFEITSTAEARVVAIAQCIDKAGVTQVAPAVTFVISNAAPTCRSRQLVEMVLGAPNVTFQLVASDVDDDDLSLRFKILADAAPLDGFLLYLANGTWTKMPLDIDPVPGLLMYRPASPPDANFSLNFSYTAVDSSGKNCSEPGKLVIEGRPDAGVPTVTRKAEPEDLTVGLPQAITISAVAPEEQPKLPLEFELVTVPNPECVKLCALTEEQMTRVRALSNPKLWTAAELRSSGCDTGLNAGASINIPSPGSFFTNQTIVRAFPIAACGGEGNFSVRARTWQRWSEPVLVKYTVAQEACVPGATFKTTVGTQQPLAIFNDILKSDRVIVKLMLATNLTLGTLTTSTDSLKLGHTVTLERSSTTEQLLTLTPTAVGAQNISIMFLRTQLVCRVAVIVDSAAPPQTPAPVPATRAPEPTASPTPPPETPLPTPVPQAAEPTPAPTPVPEAPKETPAPTPVPPTTTPAQGGSTPAPQQQTAAPTQGPTPAPAPDTSAPKTPAPKRTKAPRNGTRTNRNIQPNSEQASFSNGFIFFVFLVVVGFGAFMFRKELMVSYEQWRSGQSGDGSSPSSGGSGVSGGHTAVPVDDDDDDFELEEKKPMVSERSALPAADTTAAVRKPKPFNLKKKDDDAPAESTRKPIVKKGLGGAAKKKNDDFDFDRANQPVPSVKRATVAPVQPAPEPPAPIVAAPVAVTAAAAASSTAKPPATDDWDNWDEDEW